MGRALGPGRLARQQRGRTAAWYLDYTLADGQRSRIRLSTDKRVAEKMRTQLIYERDMALAGLSTAVGQELRLSEIADQYLADLEPQVVRRHHEGVRARLDRMIEALRDPRVQDLKPLMVMKYRTAQLSAGKSTRTANVFTTTLKAALNWSVSAGLIATNPIGSMKMLVEREGQKVHRRRAMTEGETDRFLLAAAADDAANERFLKKRRGNVYYMRRSQRRVQQAPLWRGFLETGARWGELTSTTWADVDLDRRLLSLRPEHTKSGKARVIPILKTLAADLRRLQKVHRSILGRRVSGRDLVFLSPEGRPWSKATNNAMRVFNRVLKAAEIPRVNERGEKLDIHALRHTYGTRLSRWKVGLAQAQKLMGHSDPKLTAKIYTHLDAEDLRATMDEVERRTRNKQGVAL